MPAGLSAGKLKIMYYTYVLFCIDTKRKRQKFYIGVTENIKKRLTRHKNKDIKTTKSFDIIKLIYYEACINKTDAGKREIQLKTGFGRGYINRRLENYLKERD
ncbi:GIY-YIG nuclease family protein [Patescibacteria group bacterium]